MTATMRRLGAEVDAIDVFCGFGGSSQGIHTAGATVRAAANHNPLAIECHAANFPDVDHWRADLVDPDSGDYMDPQALPAARFAWFSPGCTHHSQANATKLYARGRQASFFDDEDFDEVAFARSERSRVTMSCVLRYAEHRHPEILVVENVVEVCHWGPGRDGSTFQWWLAELKKLGYEVEPCFFNSQFFPPCPQSRDRIYIVAWRKGNKRPDLDYTPTACCISERCGGKIVAAVQTWKRRSAAWPLARWGKYGQQYDYRCPDCGGKVDPVAWPAYSAINWANLGPALGERESLGMRPLAPATVDRIKRGLAKFRGGPPIVIPAKAVWGVDRSVGEPFTTQTTQQDKALVSAMTLANRTNAQARPAADPMVTTVAGTNSLGLASSFIVKNNGSAGEAKYRARPISEPLGSITLHPAQSLVTGGVVNVANMGSHPRHGANRARRPDETLQTVVGSGGGGALVTEGTVVPVAGNTFENPGYTRARSLGQPMFTQHTTQAFGFAHMPFVAEMRGGGSGERGVHDHLSAVTAGGFHHGLASPALFAKFNGGPEDTAWHSVDESLNTVTGRDTHGLVVLPWLEQFRSDPVLVSAQLATVMTHLRHALASIEAEPLDKITDADLEAVRFRMLEPDPELRRAMAFGDEYILLGNKTQMTAGLGNAVTPPVAEWLAERCLATLRGA